MGLLADVELTLKIRRGDTIVLRNEDTHVVTSVIDEEDGSAQPLKIHFNDDYFYYTINGYIDSDEDEDDMDIVKVIRHTELG